MAYNWQGVHFEETPYHGGTGHVEGYNATNVSRTYSAAGAILATGSYTTTRESRQYATTRATVGHTAPDATATTSYTATGAAGGFLATGAGAYTCTGAIGGYGDTRPTDQVQGYDPPYPAEDHVFEQEQNTAPEFWNGRVASHTWNYVQRGRPTERGEVSSTGPGDAELDQERETNMRYEEMRARGEVTSYGDGDPGPSGTRRPQPRERSRRRHHSRERREHHSRERREHHKSKGNDREHHKSDKHHHGSSKEHHKSDKHHHGSGREHHKSDKHHHGSGREHHKSDKRHHGSGMHGEHHKKYRRHDSRERDRW